MSSRSLIKLERPAPVVEGVGVGTDSPAQLTGKPEIKKILKIRMFWGKAPLTTEIFSILNIFHFVHISALGAKV